MKHRVISNEVFFRSVKDQLNCGYSVRIPVKGESMRPFFRSNDTSVTIEKVHPSILKRLDVVLAYIPDYESYVLHRIISVRHDYIVLQGDGCIAKKEYCQPENIIGIVSRIDDSTKQIILPNSRWQLKSYIWYILYPLRRGLLWIYKYYMIK